MSEGTVSRIYPIAFFCLVALVVGSLAVKTLAPFGTAFAWAIVLTVGFTGPWGFVAAGVVAGSLAEGWAGYRAFLEGGLHGEMAFLERDSEARRSLDSILPYAKAALCVAREIPPGSAGNVADA